MWIIDGERIPATLPLPVVVVTGGVEGMGERDFLELGAFGYLLKPYTVDEVERLVGRTLEFALWGGSGADG